MVKLSLTMVTMYAVLVLAVAPATQAQHSGRFDYFDIDLLRFMDDSQNHIISPARIKVALAMVFVGARGRSAAEIATVLGLPSDPSSVTDKLQRLLYSTNPSFKTPFVEDANAVFISDAYPVISKFFRIAMDYYRARVSHVHFVDGDNKAATLINNLVLGATNGRITTETVKPGNISANTTLILVNALYFKGEWTQGFDEQLTSMKCFRNSRSKCITTPMMHVSRVFKYSAMVDLEARAVELPYGDGEYAMLVILPDEKNSVEVLISDLGRIAFSSVVNKLEPVEVVVSLPKFDIEYTVDLVPQLQNFGITEVFRQSADLSGMVQGEQIKINNIMHKAKLEVNERGPVAPTVVTIDLISITGMELPRFNANRPFLFFIYHVPTSTIILEGRFNGAENA